MKNLIIKIISSFNKCWLKIFANKSDIFTGYFFQVKVYSGDKNKIQIKNSTLRRVIGSINGEGNSMVSNNCCIVDSNITISGENNHLILEDDVRLNNSIIIIRGNENIVKIGKASTFGGIRIINVGTQNLVSIGERCLFSDNIELWASDTHSIFNESGEWINPERSVKIGDKVWIGSKVTILKGVTIDNGSVIGMGSVVTKDVPAAVISAGYPNRTIKENITWELDYKTRK